MTTAFVLSGGGNRGPLEIGALQALLEAGIRPDFFVGTSAGSLNAGFMAAYGPDLASLPRLATAWQQAGKALVYPGNVLRIAWRVLTGADSVFPGGGVRRLIEQNMPAGVTTFGQLLCPCYVTAVDLRSRRLYLFGEDPDAPLVEALLASSSVPAVHPPVPYHGLQLVDGGVVATTPAGIAIEKGADAIYAVNLGGGEEVLPPARGLMGILTRTLDTFTATSFFSDLDRAAADPAVDLHHIHIPAFQGIAFDDFDHIAEMIAAGQAATAAYLAHPQPRAALPARAAPGRALHAVPGAREYLPPAWR